VRLEFRPTAGFRTADQAAEHIRAVETEQSNSTALVDDDYVVKIYRKLDAGINPEIEIGRFLTEVAASPTRRRCSAASNWSKATRRSAIAVVQPSSQNQGDAWTVTSAYLDRFVEEQRLLAAASIPAKARSRSPICATCRKRTARRRDASRARRQRDELADFAPEPARPEDVHGWIEDVAGRAERVFDALKQRRDTIKEADRLLVDELLAQRASLRQRLGALLPPDIGSLNIRHHGDFHLGQVLIVKDDIFIIDFEGEPRRPLQARRRKGPAARDVAGLIRSIDYSATAALERALKVAGDEHGKIAAALSEWRARSAAAFLAAYRDSMTDQRLWPAEPRAAGHLLDFFLLEKAFYEIEYELAYRPEWLRVPLMGLLRILYSQPNEAS
jgi:maltose alpha-D-glucosyltransferase/alpha-amylase